MNQEVSGIHDRVSIEVRGGAFGKRLDVCVQEAGHEVEEIRCSEPNNGPSFGGPENQLMYLLDISGVSGWNDDGNPVHGSTITSYLVETNPIPEPSTALLVGLGLIGFAVRGRRV